MHHYRQALVRMRQGESDREIAGARLMGRRKLGEWRQLAAAHGWLDADVPLTLLGNDADRPARNRLVAPHLARKFADWLRDKVELRCAPGSVPQGLAVLRGPEGQRWLLRLLGSFGSLCR